MKIAVISDTHLGFGTGERKSDALLAFEEAVQIAVDRADIILFAGDMFDSPYPRSYVTLEAVRILSGLRSIRGADVSGMAGFPFIAITGNHERRSREFLDPVQMLDRAGLLKRLHGDGAIAEKDGEKVWIYGISSVPERLAGSVFRKLDPKPMDGMTNILMFHQSVTPYVYSPLEKPTLDVSTLPKGFDIIIDGHIHKREVRKIGNSIFLINGSTILTQLKSEGKKGINIIDTRDMSVEFVQLKNQREFLQFDAEKPELASVKQKIREVAASCRMKPIVRIRSRTLTKADFSDVEDIAIIVFQKMRNGQKSTRTEIREVEFKGDELFNALVEGDSEAVERLLENDYKSEAAELEVP